jgi:hypothetical protein
MQKRVLKIILSLSIFFILSDSFALAQVSDLPTKIIVSPNIWVSRRDADLPHSEPHLAVNPKDAKNLLGASVISFQGGNTSKIYSSKDGGYTWTTIEFPELGGVDPQVAFGLNGTAYFYWLGGRGFFYRSTDGGINWEKGGQAVVFDHPQMTVDVSYGQYAGNIYLSGMYSIREMGILRSKDDGKSFIGEIRIPNPHGFWLINVAPFVLNDGTLVVPYIAWDDTNGKQIANTKIEIITSNDGGVTFSEPIKVADTPFRRPPPPAKLEGSFAKQSNYASFSVDKKTNQIYVVWCNDDNGKLRTFFATSKDKGKTWSVPKAIDANIPDWADQYQTHLAVNKDGIIGVMWYDTRECARQDCYNLYFSASTDNGATFLPSRKISSETSFPITAKNLRLLNSFNFTREDSIEQSYRSAFGRWSNGGDYLGFAADSEGNFRPFWIDSRDGIFQVFTAQIKVGQPEPIPINLQTASVRDKIRLISDAPSYNLEKKEAVVPVRIRNISMEKIYSPLKLELKKMTGWKLIDSTGKEIETATIDFSNALGDWKYLPPNSISEPIKLRFRFDGLANAPNLNFDVSAFLGK